MFAGIEFSEGDGGGIALVNTKWLTPRKKEVWWPPYKQQDMHDKSLKKGETPISDKWMLFSVQRCFFEEDDYKKALKKLKQAELTSDVRSDDSEHIPSKRRVVKPKRLFSSSDDDTSDEQQHDLPPVLSGIEQIVNKRQKLIESVSEGLSSGSPQEISMPQSITSYIELETKTDSRRINKPTRSFRESGPTDSEDQGYRKKFLNLLVEIKKQNEEILHLLKQNRPNDGLHIIELPPDVPKLPVDNIIDLRNLEEYLHVNNHLSVLVQYFSKVGGKDLTNKVNTILKKLMSNRVAAEFSFLGTRNEKKSFQKLKLRDVVINAALSSGNTSESEVDAAIKVWLKHAPKRLAVENKKIIN